MLRAGVGLLRGLQPPQNLSRAPFLASEPPDGRVVVALPPLRLASTVPCCSQVRHYDAVFAYLQPWLGEGHCQVLAESGCTQQPNQWLQAGHELPLWAQWKCLAQPCTTPSAGVVVVMVSPMGWQLA